MSQSGVKHAIRKKDDGWFYCGEVRTPKVSPVFHPVKVLFIDGPPKDEFDFLVECGVNPENIELVKLTVETV